MPTKRSPANRLAQETSPYLLLHAHNPVAWYPWGEAALSRARKEGKIIFLSIGYSSCHWCHVMERESFEDEEIAAFLNEHFIAIKVDREERPDIDSIYMAALQIMTRQGGWPMSMFLTPEANPFFGATYLAPRDHIRPGVTGFLTLLNQIQTAWQQSPEQVNEQADQLSAAVRRSLDERMQRGAFPTWEMLDRVQAGLTETFDPKWGGFSFSPANEQLPKFPEPSSLMFLLHRARRAPSETSCQQARKLLITTLDHMAAGGIRDHIGGGFHRYSVDRFWRIPHFEKMLYDNGQLATVYSEAYALTGHNTYREVVEQLVEFVLRELRDDQGAFYSALDADSEGEEGKYYRWERQELQSVLSGGQASLFFPIYGIDAPPNFDDRYHVPQQHMQPQELAAQREMREEALKQVLQQARHTLLASRNERQRPSTDTKILTAWNGLMIRGLADAGRILNRLDYTKAAERAANFTLDNLLDSTGRLRRTYSNGQARLNAYLTDYALLTNGLIGLYCATKNKQWLSRAEQLTNTQITLFWDNDNGGFFFTADDHEPLLARIKNPVDSAMPSANSISARNLLFLSRVCGKADYRDRAATTIATTTDLIEQMPTAAPQMAIAISESLRDQTGESPEE